MEPDIDYKRYIHLNAHLLDTVTSKTIYTIISLDHDVVGCMTNAGASTDVDLNMLEEIKPEILKKIYNIIRARINQLHQPA